LPSPQFVSGKETQAAEKMPNSLADLAGENTEAFCLPEQRLGRAYIRTHKRKYRVYPFGNYLGVRVQLRALFQEERYITPNDFTQAIQVMYMVST
jgi:hypothetical protein